MSYSTYHAYPPALKSTVDLQLQSAFSEGNWAAVIRLADKRNKSLKDPYYDAIKLCAESRLDGLKERCAALAAVDDLVRKDVVLKDLDTIELYEWACADFQDDMEYAETLGVLRLRWVKANPKSPAVTQCLQACLQHWDLVNAQQISALLDKSSPNASDRRFMFWSITLTYLLSISPQCPEGKQKLYGLLALKQLERAADLTEASDTQEPGDRAIRAEEELYLLYRVLAALGSKDNIIERLRSPRLGALKQFREGRKHLFLEALNVLEAWERWDDIYDFCLQALSQKDVGDAPSFLASDCRVWKRFVQAASKSSNDQRAFEQVQALLETFISSKAGVAQMYKKNIALAVLEVTFRLPESLLPRRPGEGKGMPRVTQLCLFLDQNYDRHSVFDDVKAYVSDLTYEEVDHLLSDMLPELAKDGTQVFKPILIKVLELKFRYFLTTCPQTLSIQPSIVDGHAQDSSHYCRVCSKPAAPPCASCLGQLVTTAASTYTTICGDSELLGAIPSLEKDPRADLSLILTMSLLKAGGMCGSREPAANAPLHGVVPKRFLQSILVLDNQLRETPNDTTLRLLLVQLYLLLGCASYAYQLWIPMGVKRTIQDALSPLFFDRIFSLSPGLFSGSRPLMEPIRSYYSSTLRERSPVRIWDGFSSGSYSSILDIAEYDSRLRRSCTMVMSVVEERRATRAFGGQPDVDVDGLPLIASIDDSTELVNATDYGSLPSLESTYLAPIQDIVRLGPALSNERGHLSLLAEQYLDLISWKPPKDYKPSKSNEMAARDRTYLVEMLSRLHSSFTNFLHLPSTPARLTAPEETYFTVLSLLSALLLAALTSPPTGPVPQTVFTMTSSLKTSLSSLRTAFLTTAAYEIPEPATLSSLVDMHTASSLRDAALAVKHTVAFATAFHESQMACDRSGKSGLHRDVAAEVKALGEAATKALGDVKGQVKTLGAKLGEGGWLDRVLDWTLGPQDAEDDISRAVSDVIGGRDGAEGWAGKVAESWREGIKGWANVRLA